MKIYNTLTRKKEDFTPPDTRVNLFVCGPTVYDRSHIGHARTYIAFDVIVKYLRSRGVDVFYLQNITDIDDKIIHRAKEEEVPALVLSQREYEKYLDDMKRIKVSAVSLYEKASDCIPEIISQVSRMIESHHAYESNGSVYFDISTFPDFGKLSNQNLSALQKAERTKDDADKKHPHDFVLWRARGQESGEEVWDSPWGPGRPGWHIEDTAISEKHFGLQYDLHGGGADLIFPHHEAEIAQAESLSGKKPFVRFWLHNGWVTIGGEKMAKSLGNFVTIEDILKKYSSEALRLLMLQTHYRSPIEYSELSIGAAEQAIRGILEVRARLLLLKDTNGGIDLSEKTKNIKEDMEKAMDDDFNSAEAISYLFRFIDALNTLFQERAIGSTTMKGLDEFFQYVESIFGIIPELPNIPHEVMEKVRARESLRLEKKWADADIARDEVERMGFSIDDTPDGPVVLPVSNLDGSH